MKNIKTFFTPKKVNVYKHYGVLGQKSKKYLLLLLFKKTSFEIKKVKCIFFFFKNTKSII